MNLLTWMKDNSKAFRHAGSFLSYLKTDGDMLLVGEFAASLAPFYRNIGYKGNMYSYLGKEGFDRSSMVLDIYEVDKIEGEYAVISAPLYIQSLSVRELTTFLFDSYDSLSDGGLLYISFPEAIAPSVGEKTLVDSFYSEGKIYMKYYSLVDVLQSTEAVGFSISAIEMDEVDFHDRLISLALKKGEKRA